MPATRLLSPASCTLPLLSYIFVYRQHNAIPCRKMQHPSDMPAIFTIHSVFITHSVYITHSVFITHSVVITHSALSHILSSSPILSSSHIPQGVTPIFSSRPASACGVSFASLVAHFQSCLTSKLPRFHHRCPGCITFLDRRSAATTATVSLRAFSLTRPSTRSWRATTSTRAWPTPMRTKRAIRDGKRKREGEEEEKGRWIGRARKL